MPIHRESADVPVADAEFPFPPVVDGRRCFGPQKRPWQKNSKKRLLFFVALSCLFDTFNLSKVSKDKIKKFLNNYGSVINEYLVVGHTDTKGTNKYNLSLSIKRAEVVKEILINYGINQSSIKILGKGEESLAVDTPDDTKQPANRRVEIKKTN